jgi:hypothetical protein
MTIKGPKPYANCIPDPAKDSDKAMSAVFRLISRGMAIFEAVSSKTPSQGLIQALDAKRRNHHQLMIQRIPPEGQEVESLENLSRERAERLDYILNA